MRTITVFRGDYLDRVNNGLWYSTNIADAVSYATVKHNNRNIKEKLLNRNKVVVGIYELILDDNYRNEYLYDSQITDDCLNNCTWGESDTENAMWYYVSPIYSNYALRLIDYINI